MRALLLCLVLAGCGSGAVSDPSKAPVNPPLSVSPSSATAYPGLVTNFVVSGGSGSYFASSDNQGVIATPGIQGGSFAVVPATVTAQTKVNLTVSDGTASVAVPVTVQPIATAALAAVPATLAFQGSSPGTCASGIQADILIYGGKPPYTVSQASGFQASQTLVSGNPGRLTITPTGQCGAGTIAIVDSVGAATTVSATNILSSATTPAPATFTASPGAVTLLSCTDVARIILVGGSGHYFGASSHDSVVASVDGTNTAFIHRAKADAAPPTVAVVFTDGSTTQTVNVTLTGAALGKCS